MMRAFGLCALLAACSDEPRPAADSGADTTEADVSERADGADSADAPDTTGELPPCASYSATRNVYFGDLHVHTTRSLDANLQGTRLTPRDAYRFARGEKVGLQPYNDAGEALRSLQLTRPLDFAAVTDHAEFLGALTVCLDPEAVGYNHAQCAMIRDNPDAAFLAINALLAFKQDVAAPPKLCTETGADCVEATRGVWQEIQEAADAFYDRSASCTFTSFVAYEWSGNPLTANLHRNVIFRNEHVPALPTSYFDEPYPEGLWAALTRGCLEAGSGCDVLAIPHNSNLSTGRMFDGLTAAGTPFDVAYATEAAAMEPLIEVMQHKGDSECAADYPVADELCTFEKMPYNSLSSAALDLERPPPSTDFVRSALVQGLAWEETLGVNPYAFGFIASTDTHLGTPGATDEATFPGHGGAGRSSRETLAPGLADTLAFNPGGLAAVWAEENRRDAIFEGLRRKETYGTSGPRIVLRFFGGHDLAPSLCGDADFAASGYAHGVPMGGTLTPIPSGQPPRFAVWALRDPAGTPLQRVQIVKGWRVGGETQVKVYDVAGQGGGTVDPTTCVATGAGGTGADELCTVWSDPDFAPEASAWWYVRVLENPTCRWSAHQCNAGRVDCARPETVTEGFEGCCDARFAKVVQERAWSSPIWYRP